MIDLTRDDLELLKGLDTSFGRKNLQENTLIRSRQESQKLSKPKLNNIKIRLQKMRIVVEKLKLKQLRKAKKNQLRIFNRKRNYFKNNRKDYEKMIDYYPIKKKCSQSGQVFGSLNKSKQQRVIRKENQNVSNLGAISWDSLLIIDIIKQFKYIFSIKGHYRDDEDTLILGNSPNHKAGKQFGILEIFSMIFFCSIFTSIIPYQEGMVEFQNIFINKGWLRSSLNLQKQIHHYFNENEQQDGQKILFFCSSVYGNVFANVNILIINKQICLNANNPLSSYFSNRLLILRVILNAIYFFR